VGPSPADRAASANAEGEALLERGNFAAAEAAFRRALNQDPSHGPAALNLAILYHRRGEDSRALLELGSAERLLPDAVEVPLLRGQIYMGQGRYAQAARAYRRAIGQGHGRARSRLVLALVRAGKTDEARVELEVLRGSAAGHPAFDALEGLVLAAEGDVVGARERLESAAAVAVEAGPPAALGWFLMQQGDARGAIRAFRQSVDRGGDITVVRQLAEALIDGGESVEAVALIEPYAQSRPADPLVHATLARAMVGLGRNEDALRSANEALRLDPRLAPALVARGAALEAAGDVESAIRAYRAAVEEAPDHAEAYRHLAAAYRRQGRTTDAIGALERLLRLDPADRRGAMSLLELYAESAIHAQRGLRLVDHLLESEPGDPRLLELRRTLRRQAESTPRRPTPAEERGPLIIRGR
jgi:protein O-GlcNAc transferase